MRWLSPPLVGLVAFRGIGGGEATVGVGKVFIVCPRAVTGGPENMHQLCDQLNTIGADAYLWYFPNPEANHTPLYPQFPNIKVAEHVEDDPGNLLIIPEMANVREFQHRFPQMTLALWWLSYDNATRSAFFSDNLDAEAEVIHLFQSYYSYAMVRPHLSWNTWWFFITDYLSEYHLALDTGSFVAGKQDIVCFNGNKDKITRHICEKANVPYIEIKGMTGYQVMETLQTCKVYVDNSFHPGKDRLPREAALNGCVVITNKSGSAAYFEDVPIEEKTVLDLDLYELIPKVFADYRYYFDKQQHYRDAIRGEKTVFAANVENFWRRISG